MPATETVVDRPIAILLVEDQPAELKFYKDALGSAGFEVLGACRNAAVALATLARLPSDEPVVAVVDLDLPDLPGDLLISKMRERREGISFVAFTGLADLAAHRRAVAAGARGVVEKCGMKQLEQAKEAIRAVARGETWLHQRFQEQVVDDLQRQDESGEGKPTPRLSDTQRAFLRLRLHGWSYKRIAAEYHDAPATVKEQLRRAARKLGAAVNEAPRRARQLGLLLTERR